MEYDERLAQFRQTRLNPFDRGEEDGQPGGKTPPQSGKCLQQPRPRCVCTHIARMYQHLENQNYSLLNKNGIEFI